MPKQNSALVGTTAGRSNDAPRREIGEWEVRGDASIETRFDSRTGITSVVPWLVVVRFQQSGDDGRGGCSVTVEQSVEVASSSDADDGRRRVEVGRRLRLMTSESKRQLLGIRRPKD
jgi:hypothetical protein